MLIHTVLFWLKPNLNQEEKSSFQENLEKLRDIKSINFAYIGKPANTSKRPVIDDSYDYCLTVGLENLEAHDNYQEDKIHLDFIKNCSQMWDRVLIYDAESAEKSIFTPGNHSYW